MSETRVGIRPNFSPNPGLDFPFYKEIGTHGIPH